MKFNWKANWEILLVLVIIVIGIVITTIAAIRNKDKHLPFPTGGTEEAEFGQLFGSGGANDAAGVAPHDSSPEQQAKQQPPARSARRPLASPSASFADSRLHQRQPAMAVKNSGQPPPRASQTLAPLEDEQQGSLSPTMGALDQFPATTSAGQLHEAFYEPTTEPTATIQAAAGGASKHLLQLTTTSSSTNKRHVGGGLSHQQAIDAREHKHGSRGRENKPPASDYDNPSQDNDIHTTRSSLAGATSKSPGDNSTSQHFQQQQQQQQDHQSITPSLAFHGPYGGYLSPAAAGGRQPELAADSLDAGDSPLGPAPRPHSNHSQAAPPGGASRQQLSDHLMSQQQQQQQQLANLLMQPEQRPFEHATGSGQYRGGGGQSAISSAGYTGTLPISLLLGDLLKMTQPSFGATLNSAPAQAAEEGLSSVVAPPGGATTRRGILQQIRALPGGPLAALLGHAAGLQQQAPAGSPTSQDASESNFDYRISISPAEVHSILARSLANSMDALPAFPPPKGVPQPWVPPTSGGSPNHTEAQSSDGADFVANNAAGFVRAFQQQQQQANNLDSQSYPSSMDSNSASGNGQQQQQQHQQADSASLTSGSQLLQQQQQQDNFAYTNNNNNYQPFTVANQAQELLGNQMAPPAHLYQNQGSQQQQFMQQQQQQQQQGFGQAPLYGSLNKLGSHRSSEIPVPLGYSVAPQQSFQHQQRPQANVDFSNLGGLESSPKVSVASNQQQLQQQQPINRQPIVLSAISANQNKQRPAPTPSQNTGRRRRRSIPSTPSKRMRPRESEFGGEMSDNYNDDDAAAAAAARDDDEDDSYPLSVVSPDGRPLSKERFRDLAAAAASNAPEAELDHHHHESDREPLPRPSQRAPSHVARGRHEATNSASAKKFARQRAKIAHLRGGFANAIPRNRPKSSPTQYSSGRGKQRFRQPMEAASSDLLGKLLGTASSLASDESELDADMDDEDDANERRKEELDDAEFGIVSEHNNSAGSGATDDASGGGGHEQSMDSPKSLLEQANDVARTPGGTDSGATGGPLGEANYSQRRNHQPTRSDIEFYGHPGEESRQLKYGILGSGNYEVVNGGVYPEADESTAAVNSVANYVRKPAIGGSAGLLANLPHLLAGGGGGAAADEHNLRQQQAQQSGMSAFMPGGRLSVFLRGSASSTAGANPHEIDLGASFLPSSADAGKTDHETALVGPFLDLIDASNGQYLNANLISQLGSGSSARTTHISKDGSKVDKRGEQKHKSRHNNNSNTKLSANREPSGDETEPSGGNNNQQQQQQQLQQQQSSISGSRRPLGANQFNRYQILPSKKVTIFSDQDLDSAPSELDSRLSQLDSSVVGEQSRRLLTSSSKENVTKR